MIRSNSCLQVRGSESASPGPEKVLGAWNLGPKKVLGPSPDA